MSTGIVTVAAFAPLTLGVTALAVFIIGPQLPLRRPVRRPTHRYEWPVWSAMEDGGPRAARHVGRHRAESVAVAWRRQLRLAALVDGAPIRIRTITARRRLSGDWRAALSIDHVSLPGGITA